MINRNAMTILFRKIFFCFVIISGYQVDAQFNTLTRPSEIPLNRAPDHNIAGVNDRRPLRNKKKISDRLSVSNLHKEMDSLKKLMNERKSNERNFEKNNYKRLKDSIIILLKNTITEVDEKKIETEKQNKSDLENSPKFKIKFNFPLGGQLQISSKFGNRNHPIIHRLKMHNGTDFKAVYEKVFSVLDGVVTASGWDSKGGGNYMKIKHSNSFVTSYLHLSERYFKTGDKVKAGNIIARSGNSGNSTGPHLHFAVQQDKEYINPMSFLYDLSKAKKLIATYYEK